MGDTYTQLLTSFVDEFEPAPDHRALIGRWGVHGVSQMLAGRVLSKDAPDLVVAWIMFEAYRIDCRVLNRPVLVTELRFTDPTPEHPSPSRGRSRPEAKRTSPKPDPSKRARRDGPEETESR